MPSLNSSGEAYNPLFIHGGVGLGKTHLLQAICQQVLERQPEARILYLSCERFINQFIETVENGDMRSSAIGTGIVDMLVIDDIHFLAGKDRTQEEFFHTFNTLYQQQKQIILSADCPPSEIAELGRTAGEPIQLGPGRPDRKAVLRDPGCDSAKESPGPGTDAAGRRALLRRRPRWKTTRASSKGRSPSSRGWETCKTEKSTSTWRKPPWARAVAAEQRRVTIQQILDTVTKYYNVRLSDLQSKRRHKSIAFPRQVCMYLARRHTRYSLEEIGGYFGGRDHTTVLHAVRTVEKDCTDERDIADQLNQIEGQLVA